MYLLKKINLDDAWQKEQGWNEERKSGRKFDDRKELEFWEKLAPHYSEQFNLYRDVPGLKEKIFSLVGENSSVLDLGCGSGILSIAALLLGADRAVACDIDEKCMDVAYENAALNGVGRDRYTVRWGDVVTDQALRQELGGPYDVVVANIVADVIKALASTVRPLVKEGGIFLCSGIIDDRAEEVAQCLRDNGWTIAEARSSEGWFSYLCR